jgi:hypothetical protein
MGSAPSAPSNQQDCEATGACVVSDPTMPFTGTLQSGDNGHVGWSDDCGQNAPIYVFASTAGVNSDTDCSSYSNATAVLQPGTGPYLFPNYSWSSPRSFPEVGGELMYCCSNSNSGWNVIADTPHDNAVGLDLLVTMANDGSGNWWFKHGIRTCPCGGECADTPASQSPPPANRCQQASAVGSTIWPQGTHTGWADCCGHNAPIYIVSDYTQVPSDNSCPGGVMTALLPGQGPYVFNPDFPKDGSTTAPNIMDQDGWLYYCCDGCDGTVQSNRITPDDAVNGDGYQNKAIMYYQDSDNDWQAAHFVTAKPCACPDRTSPDCCLSFS